jgi:hypothetical protein
MPRDISTDEAEVSGRVGLVVFRFSQLDGHSHRFAWQCWDWSHRIGLMITAGMPLEKIWDMIEEGISSREERRHNLLAFQQWRKRAVVLKTQRNDAVHSEWWYKGSTFEIAQWTPRVKGQRRSVEHGHRFSMTGELTWTPWQKRSGMPSMNCSTVLTRSLWQMNARLSFRQTFVSPPES